MLKFYYHNSLIKEEKLFSIVYKYVFGEAFIYTPIKFSIIISRIIKLFGSSELSAGIYVCQSTICIATKAGLVNNPP